MEEERVRITITLSVSGDVDLATIQTSVEDALDGISEDLDGWGITAEPVGDNAVRIEPQLE